MKKQPKKKEPQIVEVHIYIHQTYQPVYVPQSPTAPNPIIFPYVTN